MRRLRVNQEKKFDSLLREMKSLQVKKRKDYANEDIFSNFKLCEIGNVPAWKGVAIRISDKFSRLMQFVRKEKLEVKDESLKDTLLDMAIYAIICIILFDESKGETNGRRKDKESRNI